MVTSISRKFSSWEQAVQWLREQPEQQELVLAAYYDDPLPAAADRYWRSEEWQAIRLLLPPAPGVALDVGAGRGIASYALAKEGFAVTALEPDASALVGAQAIRGLAEASGLPIEVTQEFSERLPFEDAQFVRQGGASSHQRSGGSLSRVFACLEAGRPSVGGARACDLAPRRLVCLPGFAPAAQALRW